MQSRFIFLEDDYPKLADYGRKAEECISYDPNICLLNLGRMAEFIARELCAKNNIPVEGGTENLTRKLLDTGIITEEISRKITALTEIKHDAANDGYDSEMACSRLMASAEELCKWFMSYNGGGKFAFLADLFPENCPAPPLACLAEYGREAEHNLTSNTRYSFICLGDIGEAVTDILLERDGIRPDKNTAQHERINMLFNIVGMSNKDKIDILHQLRQTRNDAVHKRYESSEEGKRLIGEALELCKWMFLFVMSEGDFVRGVITESNNDGLGVIVGEIPASVPASEIPEDKADDIATSYTVGERHIFRAKSNDGQRITLTMTQANADPWTNTARRYSRYVEGQLLNARITAITENFGMTAEIGDGYDVLEARIPESEYSLTEKFKAGDNVRASVKWLNPKEYPYIILSIRDAEESSKPDKWAGNDDSHERKKTNEAMTDKDFRAFCKSARYEEVLEALDEGANPDAKNSNGVTALMTAAEHNKDSRVVKALVEAGADIHAKDNDGFTVADYAVKNPNLEGTEILARLLEGVAPGDSDDDMHDDTENFTQDSQDEPSPEIEADIAQPDTLPEDSHDSSQPETEQQPISDSDFLELCQNGAEDDVIRAIEAGANPNATTQHGTTALMYSAMHQPGRVTEALLSSGAEIDSVNDKGNTALILAVMYHKHDNIEILLRKGAGITTENKEGKTVIEYARENLSTESGWGYLKDIKRKARNILADMCKVEGRDNESEIMRLIGHHASVKATRGSKHDTTLMYAARNKSAEVIRALIERGADVNATNLNGENALMWAAKYNDEQAVNALLEAGADIFAQDNEDNTAHHYAEDNPNLRDSEILSRLDTENDGGDDEGYVIEAPESTNQDDDNDRPLTQEQEEESRQVLRMTLQKDFLKICRSGAEEEITEAISAGVNVNVTNKTASTALMFAAQSNTAGAIDILIQAGADVNAQDDNGNTALIYAASYNTDDAVDALINAGADRGITNNAGHKASDYARHNYRLADTDIISRL